MTFLVKVQDIATKHTLYLLPLIDVGVPAACGAALRLVNALPSIWTDTVYQVRPPRRQGDPYVHAQAWQEAAGQAMSHMAAVWRGL